MGARGTWNGDHEFQMYHVEFETTSGHLRGYIQETSCDIGLDFWREQDSGTYISVLWVTFGER